MDIVLPVYNAEQYITFTLDSLLNQSHSNISIIAIDDYSTDRSFKIVQKYADKYSNIEAIRNQRNLGLVNTLNLALGKTSAEYIARMDSDDIAFPDRIQKQVKFLEENPEVGVVGTDIIYIDKYNNLSNRPPIPPIEEKISNWEILKRCYLYHPTVMFRKSLTKKLDPFYDNRFNCSEDYYLWLRVSKFTKFHVINEPLLYYRRHPTSITQSQNDKQLSQTLEMVQERITTEKVDLKKMILIMNNPLSLKARIEISEIEDYKEQVLKKYPSVHKRIVNDIFLNLFIYSISRKDLNILKYNLFNNFNLTHAPKLIILLTRNTIRYIGFKEKILNFLRLKKIKTIK